VLWRGASSALGFGSVRRLAQNSSRSNQCFCHALISALVTPDAV
jgi:hypothetical protein